MSDLDNKASPGKFRVIGYASFGGPYSGSNFVGEFDSLAEARAAVEQQLAPYREANVESPPVGFAIYDDHGNSR